MIQRMLVMRRDIPFGDVSWNVCMYLALLYSFVVFSSSYFALAVKIICTAFCLCLRTRKVLDIQCVACSLICMWTAKNYVWFLAKWYHWTFLMCLVCVKAMPITLKLTEITAFEMQTMHNTQNRWLTGSTFVSRKTIFNRWHLIIHINRQREKSHMPCMKQKQSSEKNTWLTIPVLMGNDHHYFCSRDFSNEIQLHEFQSNCWR